MMSGVHRRAPSPFWMRSISFAGLHRLLHAIYEAPSGLRATEINQLVVSNGLMLSPSKATPRPTTLYHYRRTLGRLEVVARNEKRLVPNLENPEVRALLAISPPAADVFTLSAAARGHFAALVLRNRQCRDLFFNLFFPPGDAYASPAEFLRKAAPVRWARPKPSAVTPSAEGPQRPPRETPKRHRRPRRSGEFTLQSTLVDGGAAVYGPAAGDLPLQSILYGVRYWARDELLLIDEYSELAGDGAVMFPIGPQAEATCISDRLVAHAVRFLLANRGPEPWTVFSIHQLIVDYCQELRRPRSTLFRAIDWLRQNWPQHIYLIPTSSGIATLTAISPQQENMALRNYYKDPRGPYVSHFRIHKDIDNIGVPEREEPQYARPHERARS